MNFSRPDDRFQRVLHSSLSSRVLIHIREAHRRDTEGPLDDTSLRDLVFRRETDATTLAVPPTSPGAATDSRTLSVSQYEGESAIVETPRTLTYSRDILDIT